VSNLYADALIKWNKYVNFRYSVLALAIQYPASTAVTVSERVWDQKTDHVINSSRVVVMTTQDAFNSYNWGPAYYWDNRTG